MHLNRTVAPTAEPVTWIDFKGHARVDDDTDQAYAEALITAAREYVETATGLSLMTQTWQLKLNSFTGNDGQVARNGVIVLPHPPLVSVSSITYVDADGTTQTLAASTYTANTAASPGRIYTAYNQVWPSTRDIEDAVTITYVAGYASAALVPRTIKQAILMLAAHWYNARESHVQGQPFGEVPMAVESLIAINHHGWMF